ncbi:hypothetical protein D8674_030079 [Pyrus ussuriensis x Pyrus communis]|uniref:Uncharacterized protein n=1 Tax=Pyrus ussuriensis x Pyrus communis TaxID=2448454 RepID=A0A5N5EUD7_9ROSA|nr:hypothetical protein D8674_030079 [Pyrus ussuriensis x Pyrus communis]
MQLYILNPSRVKAVSSTTQFGEPNKENKQKLQIKRTSVKEKLWEAVPPPVQELPWRKAADTTLEQLLLLEIKETFIWSYVTLGTLSFLSDIIFSIFRNYELVIPFGLFVGSLLTDENANGIVVCFAGNNGGVC